MSNEKLGAEQGGEFPWAAETMRLIDVLTPETKGKAFDPDWFLLRQRLEEREQAYHARGAGALIAPIEALIEYHEKYAKSHVSSKWIYGENMMVVQAYKKVLQMIEAQSEPGADTGTTPPPDVWTCEACGYKSDDIGEYREVCGKCFSAAAERGTTPPEGRDIEQERLEADVPYSAEYLRGFEDGRRAATQRAPVENRKVKSE